MQCMRHNGCNGFAVVRPLGIAGLCVWVCVFKLSLICCPIYTLHKKYILVIWIPPALGLGISFGRLLGGSSFLRSLPASVLLNNLQHFSMGSHCAGTQLQRVKIDINKREQEGKAGWHFQHFISWMCPRWADCIFTWQLVTEILITMRARPHLYVV